MNEGGDEQDPRPPRSRRRRLVGRVIAGLAAVAVLAFFVHVLMTPSDYKAWGSPEYAARWRDILAQYPDPESAMAARPEVMGNRFPNGEWAFGVARDSHQYKDGGTVVIKDSTGRVRAFFGHVCGGRRLGAWLSETNSLDEFYKYDQWRVFQFHEYQFP